MQDMTNEGLFQQAEVQISRGKSLRAEGRAHSLTLLEVAVKARGVQLHIHHQSRQQVFPCIWWTFSMCQEN